MFIEVTGLTHAFDDKGLKALDNINLKISSAGLYFLMGPSGHGKSTLINLLKGKLTIQKGTISINGHYQQTKFEQSLSEHFFDLPYQELEKINLQKFLGELAPFDEDPIEVARNIALEFNLEKHLRKDLSQLSQGQLARAWLGRQLASKQNVYFLDEPFQHLDPPLMREVVSLLRSIAISKDVVILLASHDRELALSFAHEIIFLHLGRILQQASPELIFHRPCHYQVANFFGPTNILLAERTNHGWSTYLGFVKIESSSAESTKKRTLVVIPPEKVIISAAAKLRGTVLEKLFNGQSWLMKVDISNLGPIHLRVPHQYFESIPEIGNEIGIQVLDEHYHSIDDVK